MIALVQAEDNQRLQIQISSLFILSKKSTMKFNRAIL